MGAAGPKGLRSDAFRPCDSPAPGRGVGTAPNEMGSSMFTVGVLKHRSPADPRVALVPAEVGRLVGPDLAVLVEAGAGAGVWYGDDAYTAAGAEVVSREEVLARADIIAVVRRPDPSTL